MSDRLLDQEWVGTRSEASIGTALAAFSRSLRAAWRRHRSRRCLAGLDAHLLKDIGVGFAEAEAEANKPFWQQ